MVKAKIGFEDLYDSVVAKQAALETEKQAAIDAAIAEVKATFATREAQLGKMFEVVADVVEDAPAEDVAPETVATEAEATSAGNVTFAG